MPNKILFISKHYRPYKMKCPNPMCSDTSSIKIRRSCRGERKLKKDVFCTYCMTRYALIEFDLEEPPLIQKTPVRRSLYF
mgnify:CR=1 FL=1